MKRFCYTLLALLVAAVSIQAQQKLDMELIEETVKNERGYFNDILNVFMNDDPLIRIDDVALVYYGYSFLPEYKGGNDANEEKLKNAVAEGNNSETYTIANKILEYNPVSLNALFYAWRSSEALGHQQDKVTSYVTKYLNILNMITSYGNGKSSRTPYYVISPDDQDHILYGILDIENVIERRLDTETLCNIIKVTPSNKYRSSIVYINVSRFLSHTSGN